MVFLSLFKPEAEQVKDFVASTRNDDFNYDAQWRGATEAPLPQAQLESEGYFVNRGSVRVGSGRRGFEAACALVKKWRHFQLDWADVDPATPIHPGSRLAVRARSIAVWTLNPLQIAYVTDNDSTSPVSSTAPVSGKSAVSSKTAVSSVSATSGLSANSRALAVSRKVGAGGKERETGKGSGSAPPPPPVKHTFAFGSGTLRGHFLAGEERFAVDWDEANDDVVFSITSFSKPAHIISLLTLPYVRFAQRSFVEGSTKRMVEEVKKSIDD